MTTLPLEPHDLASVRGLVAARARVARKFALAAGVLTLGYLVRAALRAQARGGSASAATWAVEVVVVALVLALFWHFGLRPLAALRRDLDAAVKQVRAGTIGALQRLDNAYGETITWATIDGARLMTKGELFAGMKVGDRVVVELLPGARVVLAARLVGR